MQHLTGKVRSVAVNFLTLVFMLYANPAATQHNDIVFEIPTDVTVHIDRGDYYWIDIDKFEINGNSYKYGEYKDITGSVKLYDSFAANLIILEGSGGVYPLRELYGKFAVPSGQYRIIFNVKINSPATEAIARLTLVTPQTHQDRNRYNQLALGRLTRPNSSTDIFTDEAGTEWELVNMVGNYYHGMCNTVKLLHKVPGGGEYETIRILEQDEKGLTGCGIKSGQLQLQGCNLLTNPKGSTYNFGQTSGSSFLPGHKHYELDMRPHEELGLDYNYYSQGCTVQSTLFLFDLSGSMSGIGAGGSLPKIDEAKQASQRSLATLQAQSSVKNQVAVYGFSGGCVPDPTVEISAFDTDLKSVEQRILTMKEGGGTPLAAAITAAKCKMAAHLREEGQSAGKIILLSDGVSSCGPIRPPGVYNTAPLQQRQAITVNNRDCQGSTAGGNGVVAPTSVSYYTIGFDIPPGSPAERDLQYLASSSGGQYLNVQNQTQLIQAFRKFNRVYRPKATPALAIMPGDDKRSFDQGLTYIRLEDYEEALDRYSQFTSSQATDCNGHYNFALMQEANDFYPGAIESYRKYLALCPEATDSREVNHQIAALEEEFNNFVHFQRQVVMSDLEFLDLHFQRIQHGESIALAEEFKGFIVEKGSFYRDLPKRLGSDVPAIRSLALEIAESLDQCGKLIKRDPANWDRDASPIISMTYLTLTDLLERL